MSFPTPVNNQITDSVTQTNTKVIGDGPAVSLGSLYVATGEALSNAAHHDGTFEQQPEEVSGLQTLQNENLDTPVSPEAEIYK